MMFYPLDPLLSGIDLFCESVWNKSIYCQGLVKSGCEGRTYISIAGPYRQILIVGAVLFNRP